MHRPLSRNLESLQEAFIEDIKEGTLIDVQIIPVSPENSIADHASGMYRDLEVNKTGVEVCFTFDRNRISESSFHDYLLSLKEAASGRAFCFKDLTICQLNAEVERDSGLLSVAQEAIGALERKSGRDMYQGVLRYLSRMTRDRKKDIEGIFDGCKTVSSDKVKQALDNLRGAIYPSGPRPRTGSVRQDIAILGEAVNYLRVFKNNPYGQVEFSEMPVDYKRLLDDMEGLYIHAVKCWQLEKPSPIGFRGSERSL